MIQKRICYCLSAIVLCATVATGQVTTDKRLMSDAEYKTFLIEVATNLPLWEAALKSVDPARIDMSYADGEKVLRFRDLALKEAGWTRASIQKERAHRRVSQELALSGFIQGIFDNMQNVQLYGPNMDVDLERLMPEIGVLIGKIGNDVQARVELLEQETCPSEGGHP